MLFKRAEERIAVSGAGFLPPKSGLLLLKETEDSLIIMLFREVILRMLWCFFLITFFLTEIGEIDFFLIAAAFFLTATALVVKTVYVF